MLHEALRVDVDRDADAAARRRGGGEQRAQEALQVGAARRLHRETEAVAAAQHRDRRLGRAEQRDLVALRRAAERRDPPALAGRERMAGAGERARVRFRAAAVLAGDDDRRQAAERRQAAAPPLLGLLGVEALDVARRSARR